MSSFPEHKANVNSLQEMGFDVSDLIIDGQVTLDSWSYDELTFLLGGVIQVLEIQNFKVNNND